MKFKKLFQKVIAMVLTFVTTLYGFCSIGVFAIESKSDIQFTSKALLIEDELPWESNANSQVLESLNIQYDKTTASNFMTKDL